MTPYRKPGKLTFTVFVPTPTGGVKRSSGTRDRKTANAMQRMLQDLGPKGTRRWDLLSAVVDNRISVGTLYDAFIARDLDGLRARLDDVDLRPYLTAWRKWAGERMKAETADRYATHLAALHPTDDTSPWLRSSLTTEHLATWLGRLEVSGPTKRKYAAAVASFVAYLRQLKVLASDPLADLELPKPAAPNPEFLEREEVGRLVDGSPLPYRHLFAILYGTGADITPALAVLRRDVDLGNWTIRMAGTKSHNRDRVVIVAEWARPQLRELCRGLMPDAPLFPGITRNWATKQHARCLSALGLRHLKMHAARNHWAVRAIRGGWSLEAVARQLGNTPEIVMRVYGRFVPSTAELARLERSAEVEDRRREADRKKS